jgi:2-polyprenyl-3-methyl-5-hydroxy-6-metoxy-1,4-benzoquinol methylase
MQKTEINRMFYDSHWRQSWKANFMYDPISKRKIARYVLERAGFEDGKKEILDIGFGFGIILFSFDRSDNIQGVELADSAVELAREKARKRGYHNFEFLKYSGEGRIPLED